MRWGSYGGIICLLHTHCVQVHSICIGLDYRERKEEVLHTRVRLFIPSSFCRLSIPSLLCGILCTEVVLQARSTPTCSFYASCDVASFPTCLKTKKSFCPWVSIIALAYGLPSEELKRLRVRTDSFFNTRLIKLTKGPFRTVRFPLGNYARGPVSNTDPNIHVDTVVSSKRKNSNSQSESKSPSHRFQLVGGGGDGVTIHTKDNYAPHLLCLNATLSPHFEREKEREWFQSAEWYLIA